MNNYTVPDIMHLVTVVQRQPRQNSGNYRIEKRKVIFTLGIGHYTKATEIRHMGYTSAHVPRAVTLAYPTYFATFPSSRLAILLTGSLREQQKLWAEWRTPEVNGGEHNNRQRVRNLSTAIPTLHGNSFRGLSIAWGTGSPLADPPQSKVRQIHHDILPLY